MNNNAITNVICILFPLVPAGNKNKQGTRKGEDAGKINKRLEKKK